jgi:hypothetical protein
MTPVRAVLFDYGMVLSAPPDPAVWARLLTLTGLTEDILHREYRAHHHAWDRGDPVAPVNVTIDVVLQPKRASIRKGKAETRREENR